MSVVGAILCYPHLEPTFNNSSHGQSPSTRPTSSLEAEDHTLCIVLPNHHIWAPHTRQRAVFSTSSRSRTSTTVVIENHCPKGCRSHPSYVEGIDVPLLRRVEDVPGPAGSRTRSWQHFTERSSRIISRRSNHLIQHGPQEVPETKPTSTPLSDQALDSSARQGHQCAACDIYRQTLGNNDEKKHGAGTRSV